MKACPLCSSTYDERVDFCFRDGAPLVAASPEVQAAALADSGIARFTEALDVPEPRSLDVTDAPEPSFLRTPPVPTPERPPPPPPLTPSQPSGDETLPPLGQTPFVRPSPPDPEQLSVDVPSDLPGPVSLAPPLAAPEVPEAPEPTLAPVTVPPPPAELNEPDTTDFFADEPSEPPPVVDDQDEDDLYGGIPYAETPKKKDKLPLILAGLMGIVIIGGAIAFSGGKDDPEPVGKEITARPAPARPPVKPPPASTAPPPPEPVEPPPAATEPDPGASAATTPSGRDAGSTTEAQPEGGNGIGSVDRATERERQRQERREAREQANADQAQADQDSESRRREEARRDAERKEAERKEAERKEAERKEAERQGDAVAATESAPAGNPWGQANDVSEGTLRITTTPKGASVWIDESPKGKSPVSAKLPFGSYKVRVAMDGYKDKSMAVDLQSASRDLAFTLPQDVRSGPVIIYGSLGAIVYLGDKRLGPIPVSATLQEGTSTFTVVQEGTFYKVTKTISFENVQGTLPLTLTAQ